MIGFQSPAAVAWHFGATQSGITPSSKGGLWVRQKPCPFQAPHRFNLLLDNPHGLGRIYGDFLPLPAKPVIYLGFWVVVSTP